MPYDLAGKSALVTGGSRGLGALIAQKLAAEGCNVAINYVLNAERAEATASSIERNHCVKTFLVRGDVGIEADAVRMVQATVEAFGSLDIIISNAGWTKFVKFGDLKATTDDDWDKCWAVNVKAQLYLFREASRFFNANNDGGVFLITSSLAGVSPSGSSMPYSVTKAAGLHLMKALAVTQGSKIRINAILPGLLLTEWGANFTPEQLKTLTEKAILKKETELEDCADAFIAAAKNASMTGQYIQTPGCSYDDDLATEGGE